MSYKKMLIPEVAIELGDDLYLQIKDVSFIPFKKGYISGLPEDCYEDEPAECDWLNENAKLVIKKKRIIGYADSTLYPMIKKVPLYDVSEKEFDVDDSFVYEYYDKIIEQIEEDLSNGN